MTFIVDPDRVIADLRTLASFGSHKTGVDRTALSENDLQARLWLLAQMHEAGLEASIDAVGNVVGRTAHARRLLVGSHTDTVPRGGWLDGALGVVVGLEIARAVKALHRDLPIGFELISFSDEEGSFLSFMGSKVFCSEMSVQEAQELRNLEGETVRAAIAAAGLADSRPAGLDPTQHLAFLELHIEQGPVLERLGIDLGIVTNIVGMRQDRVTFLGEANHAGTTPMHMRRDAAASMFAFASSWPEVCKELAASTTVWNIGKVEIDPGAHNVVAGRATATCQYRDTEIVRLEQMSAAILECAASAAAKYQTDFRLDRQVSVVPTPMDAAIARAFEDNAHAAGFTTQRMPSGAGHDAMILGKYIPAGMLFVPSKGGISHSIMEDTDPEDLRRGIQVFAATIGGFMIGVQ